LLEFLQLLYNLVYKPWFLCSLAIAHSFEYDLVHFYCQAYLRYHSRRFSRRRNFVSICSLILAQNSPSSASSTSFPCLDYSMTFWYSVLIPIYSFHLKSFQILLCKLYFMIWDCRFLLLVSSCIYHLSWSSTLWGFLIYLCLMLYFWHSHHPLSSFVIQFQL